MKTDIIEFTAPRAVSFFPEKEELPEPPLDTAWIRNEMTLVSTGTELARLKGMQGEFPIRPGYTAIGEIMEKHPSITDFEIGDRVFYAGQHASVCAAQHNQDHQWGRLYEVPAGIPVEKALFAGLAQISLTAPVISQTGPGDTVAVFGLGPIGNLAAQLFQMYGARVLAFDPVEARCEQARACGLPEVFSVAPGKGQVACIHEHTDGKGVQVAVDAVGHIGIIETAVEAAADLGKVVLLGTPWTPGHPSSDTFLQDIHLRGIALLGAHMFRYPALECRGVKENVEAHYRMLFQAISEERLSVEPLLSHIASPKEAPAMYEGLLEHPEEYVGVAFDWR